MIAHAGPVPVEELFPLLAVAGGGGLALAGARLRAFLSRLRLDSPIPAAPRRRGSPPDADRLSSEGNHPEDAHPIGPGRRPRRRGIHG